MLNKKQVLSSVMEIIGDRKKKTNIKSLLKWDVSKYISPLYEQEEPQERSVPCNSTRGNRQKVLREFVILTTTVVW